MLSRHPIAEHIPGSRRDLNRGDACTTFDRGGEMTEHILAARRSIVTTDDAHGST
jgi:hypothetical protein